MKEINQKGINTLTIFQHGEVTITAFQTLLLWSVFDESGDSLTRAR